MLDDFFKMQRLIVNLSENNISNSEGFKSRPGVNFLKSKVLQNQIIFI